MYEKFTDRSRKVMRLANQEAVSFGHEYLGTEHILLGLIKENSGVAVNVLKNMDISLDKVRNQILDVIQLGSKVAESKLPESKLPQTFRVKKAIEYAIEEAATLNHNYIGTEHLLLGLLKEDEGVASQVLVGLGVVLEDVREEIVNLLGQLSVEETTKRIQIKIETNTGELICERFIPENMNVSNILIWNKRYFKLYEPGVYREVLAYAVS